MTLEGIILGLVAIAVGAAFTFWGFRFFLLLLPVWGFLFGFLVGADVVTYLFGQGFLSTTFSWLAGFVVGLIFAALSYLYYWFAVVWIGATAGYALGTGIMTWLTPNAGTLTFVVGIILAVAVAIAIVALHVPKYIVLIATAFGGAFAVMAGIALLLGRVPYTELHNGTVGLYVKDSLSWVWVGAAVLLGIAGFFYQWMATSSTEFVEYHDYRNPGMGSMEPAPPRPM
jgi:hypothetical protein